MYVEYKEDFIENSNLFWFTQSVVPTDITSMKDFKYATIRMQE